MPLPVDAPSPISHLVAECVEVGVRARVSGGFSKPFSTTRSAEESERLMFEARLAPNPDCASLAGGVVQVEVQVHGVGTVTHRLSDALPSSWPAGAERWTIQRYPAFVGETAPIPDGDWRTSGTARVVVTSGEKVWEGPAMPWRVEQVDVPRFEVQVVAANAALVVTEVIPGLASPSAVEGIPAGDLALVDASWTGCQASEPNCDKRLVTGLTLSPVALKLRAALFDQATAVCQSVRVAAGVWGTAVSDDGGDPPTMPVAAMFSPIDLQAPIGGDDATLSLSMDAGLGLMEAVEIADPGLNSRLRIAPFFGLSVNATVLSIPVQRRSKAGALARAPGDTAPATATAPVAPDLPPIPATPEAPEPAPPADSPWGGAPPVPNDVPWGPL